MAMTAAKTAATVAPWPMPMPMPLLDSRRWLLPCGVSHGPKNRALLEATLLFGRSALVRDEAVTYTSKVYIYIYFLTQTTQAHALGGCLEAKAVNWSKEKRVCMLEHQTFPRRIVHDLGKKQQKPAKRSRARHCLRCEYTMPGYAKARRHISNARKLTVVKPPAAPRTRPSRRQAVSVFVRMHPAEQEGPNRQGLTHHQREAVVNRQPQTQNPGGLVVSCSTAVVD